MGKRRIPNPRPVTGRRCGAAGVLLYHWVTRRHCGWPVFRFPKELVLAIAGLALLGTIANSLTAALAKTEDREVAGDHFLGHGIRF